VDEHSQARDLKPLVDNLIRAGVILAANHCGGNGLPLRAEMSHKVRKLYFLDVGLLNFNTGSHHIPMASLATAAFINKGVMAEQFVAQHLGHQAEHAPELNYWLREGKSNNAEIDFLLARNGKVCPVEVKAGEKGGLKSLHRFMYDKGLEHAVRLDLNLPSSQQVCVNFKYALDSVSVDYRLHSLPLYLVECLSGAKPFFYEE